MKESVNEGKNQGPAQQNSQSRDVELLEVKMKAGEIEITVQGENISIRKLNEENKICIPRFEMYSLIPGLIKASLINLDKLM